MLSRYTVTSDISSLIPFLLSQPLSGFPVERRPHHATWHLISPVAHQSSTAGYKNLCFPWFQPPHVVLSFGWAVAVRVPLYNFFFFFLVLSLVADHISPESDHLSTNFRTLHYQLIHHHTPPFLVSNSPPTFSWVLCHTFGSNLSDHILLHLSSLFYTLNLPQCIFVLQAFTLFTTAILFLPFWSQSPLSDHISVSHASQTKSETNYCAENYIVMVNCTTMLWSPMAK